MNIQIGIQGSKGSTTERACVFFTELLGIMHYETQHLISTENVLHALNKNEIDYGVFAWESSRAGLVQETQEAIKKYAFVKITEQDFQIDHALLTNAHIDNTQTVHVYSHPQALKEHFNFLLSEFADIKLVDEVDTAVAAKRLSEHQYPKNSVVIAPIACGRIYGLDVYHDNLPFNQGYFTKIYFVKKVV